MENLPIELIESIVAHLNRADLSNLRLASRQISQRCAHLLYPRLWLSSHALDIQVFRRVVKNPNICDGVRELVWDDSTYCDSLLELENYLLTAEEVGSHGPFTSDGYSEEDMREGHRLFSRNATLERVVRRKRIDERVLRAGLGKLKNLRTVVLSRMYHRWHLGGEFMYSPTARQWSREPAIQFMPFTPTVNWKVVEDEQERADLSASEVASMRSVDYREDVWDEQWSTYLDCVQVLRPFRGLLILIRALRETGTAIETFIVRPQYKHGSLTQNRMVGISHWFFRYWSADLDTMVAAFRNLRKLHLVISADGDGREGAAALAFETVRRGHLTRVLQSLSFLEDLYLEIPEMSALQVLGREHLFPALRSLALMYACVEPTELLQFLILHRATLRESLALKYCKSTSTGWRDFFIALKDHGLYVKSITATTLYDPQPANWWYFTTAKSAMDDYLLHDGPWPLAWDDGLTGAPLAQY